MSGVTCASTETVVGSVVAPSVTISVGVTSNSSPAVALVSPPTVALVYPMGVTLADAAVMAKVENPGMIARKW